MVRDRDAKRTGTLMDSVTGRGTGTQNYRDRYRDTDGQGQVYRRTGSGTQDGQGQGHRCTGTGT
jgi:hypothetical protein